MPRIKRTKPTLNLADIPRLGRRQGIELKPRGALQGSLAGRHVSRTLGGSTEFTDHRAYQFGDDLRQIDWKAYARNDHLVVKRYQDDRDLPLWLLLDTSASMGYGEPRKLATAQRAAAILGLLCLDQGDRVRIAKGAAKLKSTTEGYSGVDKAERFLRALEADPVGASDLPMMIDHMADTIKRPSMLVILSDFFTEIEDLSRPLAGLRKRGHEPVLIQILHPDEVALPDAWENVRFVDPEQCWEDVSGNARRLSDTFAEAMREHIQSCSRLAAVAGAEHVLIADTQDPVEHLGRWLAKRGALR